MDTIFGVHGLFFIYAHRLNENSKFKSLYLFTGLKRLERSEPWHGKRFQGAVDARRRVCRRTFLYFKCPVTKQMRYPENAYKSFYDNPYN